MAALDGKITIERGLRPCIVRIPDKKKQFKEMKALFHCWNHKSELVGESCLRGGHPAGQISQTFGIVEYEDGTIHEVETTQIRFADNAMSEYALQECDFCKEIRKVDEDRIYEDNPLEAEADEEGKLILCEVEGKIKFYGFNKYIYDIDTIYKNVDNVNFCPVCGRKL